MSNTSVRVHVPSALLLLLITATCAGGEAEERLPGSRISLQEAVRSSSLIVTAKGIDMGPPSIQASSGKRHYGHVKLKVVRSLKGDGPKEIFPVRATLITLPKAAEKLPGGDGDYIVFLGWEPPQTPKAVKVLRATEENIRATMKAVSAEPRVPGRK